MALTFCSFASGSSGNCYLVGSDDTKLLIDVGITGKRVLEGLAENQMTVEQVDGILLTHEHADHVKSIRMIGKMAEKATVYGSLGTLNQIEEKVPSGRTRTLPTDEFYIGDILVKPFHLSHDAAEPMGYSFAKEGKQISIVTDTGCVTEEIFSHIKEADLLIMEANHEVNILKMGSYPYNLKRRILGDEGHLSNEATGHCICKMLEELAGEKIPKVVLAHLSNENNTPKQAYLTIRNILFEKDYFIDKHLKMDIIPRDKVSEVMEV